jgi:predicted patatin/cPLA2 family phospholipase
MERHILKIIMDLEKTTKIIVINPSKEMKENSFFASPGAG